MKIKIFLPILIFTIGFLYFNNNYIVTRKIDIHSRKTPLELNDFKIVQISDLHSKSFGKNQRKLINSVKNQKPNLIVLTGDMVDRRRYNEKPVIDLVKEVIKIAPTYYITGNHEIWSGNFNQLQNKLTSIGVRVLRNEIEEIKIGNEKIYIMGLDYPHGSKDDKEIVENTLTKLHSNIENDKFKILLAHRPDLIDTYSIFPLDLVFSGHAHGGQIRLPFMGGVIAPHQGFLPKYTSGLYKKHNTQMVVSRGLGNSLSPFRVFNFPEIITVTLYAQ
ncbi:metallophosphoesterase [Alkalithermobacter paradoxus]|uniref:Putative metallophosphoesterase n=1 Tax=Alkalithermobacter paradoxus TaxID=29349 RepID=A0A1V4I7J3_9FIRM|nr:putative metallophosphoesterase [[Clostridium] thermoalcaliphilum]